MLGLILDAHMLPLERTMQSLAKELLQIRDRLDVYCCIALKHN
ncbi:MAG TPA: hypothetical protein VMF89_12560 [Polyangiales bacterium]|nr:hypothetical protein [Polyangiales bacterium]